MNETNNKEPKIKEVTGVNSQGSSYIRVGIEGVTEISRLVRIDGSGRLHTTYNAYQKDGKLYKQFINLPVEVEYFL